MVISQVAMVAVMTMTPVHMKLHGHESVSQYVVSLHIAGMYAFSPFVGKYADRKGTVAAVILGAGLLVASGALSALSGESWPILFPSLWLLGIGWNFGLIGGSSMLIESVPVDKRVTVQGSADLMMSFCGGMAGLSSGFIRRAVGYHLLSVFALVLCGLLLAFAIYVRTAERTRDTIAA
jgi:MFS family permease